MLLLARYARCAATSIFFFGQNQKKNPFIHPNNYFYYKVRLTLVRQRHYNISASMSVKVLFLGSSMLAGEQHENSK